MLSLETLDLHLTDPELALLCKRCNHAVKPVVRSVLSHLEAKHDLTGIASKDIRRLLVSVPVVDPRGLSIKPDGSAAHPYLAEQPGWACRLCPYLTTSIELAHRHMLKSHGIARSTLAEHQDKLGSVTLQSWDHNGAGGYWVVVPGRELNLSDTSLAQTSLPRLYHYERLMDSEARGRDHASRRSTDVRAAARDDNPDMALVTNWMRRTDWAKTFAGADRHMLVKLSQLPFFSRVKSAITAPAGTDLQHS